MKDEEFEREFEKWFGEPWKVGHRRRIKMYLTGMAVGLFFILISFLI